MPYGIILLPEGCVRQWKSRSNERDALTIWSNRYCRQDAERSIVRFSGR